jgi:hypothetical protein
VPRSTLPQPDLYWIGPLWLWQDIPHALCYPFISPSFAPSSHIPMVVSACSTSQRPSVLCLAVPVHMPAIRLAVLKCCLAQEYLGVLPPYVLCRLLVMPPHLSVKFVTIEACVRLLTTLFACSYHLSLWLHHPFPYALHFNSLFYVLFRHCTRLAIGNIDFKIDKCGGFG